MLRQLLSSLLRSLLKPSNLVAVGRALFSNRRRITLVGVFLAGLAALGINILPDWLAPYVHRLTGYGTPPAQSAPLRPEAPATGGGFFRDIYNSLMGRAAPPARKPQTLAAAPAPAAPLRPPQTGQPPRPQPLSPAQLFAGYADLRLSPAQINRLPDSPLPPAIPAGVVWRRIERVLDGDTVAVDGETVRVLGIDAPESNDNDHLRRDLSRLGAEGRISEMLSLGEEAKRFLRQAEGRMCWLEYDGEQRDQYGRILAHVRLEDNASVAEIMLYQGYAKVYMSGPTRYQKRFIQLQDQAMRERRGLWGWE